VGGLLEGLLEGFEVRVGFEVRCCWIGTVGRVDGRLAGGGTSFTSMSARESGKWKPRSSSLFGSARKIMCRYRGRGEDMMPLLADQTR